MKTLEFLQKNSVNNKIEITNKKRLERESLTSFLFELIFFVIQGTMSCEFETLCGGDTI